MDFIKILSERLVKVLMLNLDLSPAIPISTNVKLLSGKCTMPPIKKRFFTDVRRGNLDRVTVKEKDAIIWKPALIRDYFTIFTNV